MRFAAVMEMRGINPFVRVSAARASALQADWRKPMPVRVRINGQPEAAWRINMMPAGDGSFYLYLHASVREASATQVGDRVRVEVTFDDTYEGGPVHALPPAFAAGLRGVRGENWRALSPSRQKEILRYFAALKSPDALAHNIDRALHVLSGEEARFMGRAWKDGH